MKRKKGLFLSVDLACLSGSRAAASSGFTERRNEVLMATVSGNRELSGISEGISITVLAELRHEARTRTLVEQAA
jgi:hypothetical protein